MSLIDEALRRARQEAARQDAVKRDAQYRQVPTYAPPRRSGLSPALIGAIVALCIVAGIGIGIFLGRDRAAGPAPAKTPAPVESPPPAEPPLRPVLVTEETPAAPVPTPIQIPEETPVRQEVPAVEAEPLEPPPAPDPAPVEVPEPPAPAPTPEPAPAPEARSYVREVPLPDGGTLRLNGIAFSAAQPVALIDDKVLAKGESYQGFVVTDIQANLVELRGNGMTVRVSLK